MGIFNKMIPHAEYLRKPITNNLDYDLNKLLVVGGNSSIFVPEGFVGTTGTEKGIVLVGCFSVAIDFGDGAILTHHGSPFIYHARHLEEIATLRQTHRLSQPPVVPFSFIEVDLGWVVQTPLNFKKPKSIRLMLMLFMIN